MTVLLPEYNLKREDLFITSKIPVYDPVGPTLVNCKEGLEVVSVTTLKISVFFFLANSVRVEH